MTTEPATPTTRARSDQTRDQILSVASRVFADRGYRQTDVQVIADELGLGKGTIYRHFASKEGLFLACVDRGMCRLTAFIEAEIALLDDPLDRIRAGVQAYLAFFDRHPHLVELLMQERAEFPEREQPTYFAHREANAAKWELLLQGLIDEGRLRPIPVRRMLDVINDVLYGAIFVNAFAGRATTLETQAGDILDVLLHGLLPRAEEKP